MRRMAHRIMNQDAALRNDLQAFYPKFSAPQTLNPRRPVEALQPLHIHPTAHKDARPLVSNINLFPANLAKL